MYISWTKLEHYTHILMSSKIILLYVYENILLNSYKETELKKNKGATWLCITYVVYLTYDHHLYLSIHNTMYINKTRRGICCSLLAARL